jgi:hypothetical protein
VVVFDDTADMLGLARFAMEFCAIESCGKCTPCRIGAVRGVETLDRIAAGDGAATELLVDLCETMKDGSLCALGGFTPYPVMSALRQFPEEFAPPGGGGVSRFSREERVGNLEISRTCARMPSIFGKMKAGVETMRDFIIPGDDRDMGTPAKPARPSR